MRLLLDQLDLPMIGLGLLVLTDNFLFFQIAKLMEGGHIWVICRPTRGKLELRMSFYHFYACK